MIFDTCTAVNHRSWAVTVGPALSKKVFPVQRPGELKRADWNFFLPFPLYIQVYTKMKLGKKKKNPDLPTGRLFGHPAYRKQFFTSGWPW